MKTWWINGSEHPITLSETIAHTESLFAMGMIRQGPCQRQRDECFAAMQKQTQQKAA